MGEVIPGLILASALVLGVDPAATQIAARAPTATERAVAAGGAAVGALAGGLLGASGALAAGAALSNVNPSAQPLPYFALPPPLCALGAGVGGWAAHGPRAGWAAGVASFLASGAATLGLGLALVDQGSTSGAAADPGSTLLLAVAAPTLAGALAAGAAAALFAEGAP